MTPEEYQRRLDMLRFRYGPKLERWRKKKLEATEENKRQAAMRMLRKYRKKFRDLDNLFERTRDA